MYKTSSTSLISHGMWLNNIGKLNLAEISRVRLVRFHSQYKGIQENHATLKWPNAEWKMGHIIRLIYFYVVVGSQSNENIYIVHFWTPKGYLVNYSIHFLNMLLFIWSNKAKKIVTFVLDWHARWLTIILQSSFHVFHMQNQKFPSLS